MMEASSSAGDSASPCPGVSSTWTESLKQVGTYFEGIVDDADTLLLEHTNATVTTYGTRTSRKIQVHAQLIVTEQLNFLYIEWQKIKTKYKINIFNFTALYHTAICGK